MHSIFFAYVGGVFQSSGLNALHQWIDPLLSQENLIQPEEAPGPTIVNPPPKRIKSEALSPPPGFFKPTATPTPFARPNPLAPARPDTAFLPLFNQEAAKRRVTVEYLWEFSGQSHAGRWIAKRIGESVSHLMNNVIIFEKSTAYATRKAVRGPRR